MKRYVQYGGYEVDIDIAPKDAAKLLLNRASGCASKSMAWSYATDAEMIVREKFPDKLSEFREALGNGRYPDTSAAALVFV